jgi:hypothetical protein
MDPFELPNADLPTIVNALQLLKTPATALEAVTELRILHVLKGGTISGYFADLTELAAAAAHYSGQAPGVYITLNPVDPTLLARATNHVITWAKHTTSDADILHRVWLPIDFDPARPSGISSDSGNGAHLLYRIDLPNTPESTALVKQCLAALALYFSDDVVAVDGTTHNASRVWKLYGTLARKGDPLPERPHRLAWLLDVPETVEVVTREQLERLAAIVPPPPPAPGARRSGSARAFDLATWITDHHLPVVQTKPWQGGHIWLLNPCPWNATHANRAAFVIQFANGAIAAGCHHNSCAGNDWHALWELYEPG